MADPVTVDPWRVSDGVVVIRPPRPGDGSVLVAGRDAEGARWFERGACEPQPTACITRDGDVVGWVDHETGQEWLAPDEVNVGYHVFAAHRRRGFASRAVSLLVHRLAIEGRYRTASARIRRASPPSFGVAVRAGFGGRRALGEDDYLFRTVPALRYGDGVVTIRRQDPADVDADLAAKDEEQIRWLWLPGERERWESMTPQQRRANDERWLRTNRDTFGAGPTWMFTVDTAESRCVAGIGCDLASPVAPAGDANIAYACHPDHRGRGHVARAVRLILRFVAEHTGARRAHLVIDRDNEPSLRLARSVTTVVPTEFVNGQGRPTLRFVMEVDRCAPA